TTKPMMLCLNVGEGHLSHPDYPLRREVMDLAQLKKYPVVEISASIEREIADLEGDEKQLFMEEIGIEEAGII
ncbi:MAG TPA: redox-regulated ATPase YchF, partial [Syntrophomonas wolfei]|nr:redox-regulated ATPase YchF [Syntrophomonas wolfei]